MPNTANMAKAASLVVSLLASLRLWRAVEDSSSSSSSYSSFSSSYSPSSSSSYLWRAVEDSSRMDLRASSSPTRRALGGNSKVDSLVHFPAVTILIVSYARANPMKPSFPKHINIYIYMGCNSLDGYCA